MSRFEVRPRIRVTRDDGTIVIGPGKVDLLEAIAAHGSLRAAAKSVGMSYMRAWTLVRTMNDTFRSPLVEKLRGGMEKGSARLTERGERILQIYRAMEKSARKAIDPEWRRIRRELK